MKTFMRFSLIQLVLLFPMSVFSQGYYTSQSASPFLDPAFQDFVETTYGYKNPAHIAKLAPDYRDALTEGTAVTLKAALAFAAAQSAVKAEPKISNRSGRGAESKSRTAAPAAFLGSGAKQFYNVSLIKGAAPTASLVQSSNSGTASGFRAWDYVFISVLPKSANYPGLINSLAATGFKFAGERTYFSGSGKKTFLLGWASYANLERIYKHRGVRGVSIEKKTAGIPLKTRIRFTLKVPSGARSSAFVSDFLRELKTGSGFVSESAFRLPQGSALSKFGAVEVTGSLPLDMINELAQSPYVAAIELKDKSL